MCACVCGCVCLFGEEGHDTALNVSRFRAVILNRLKIAQISGIANS